VSRDVGLPSFVPLKKKRLIHCFTYRRIYFRRFPRKTACQAPQKPSNPKVSSKLKQTKTPYPLGAPSFAPFAKGGM
jgi:hypothetical protein